MGSNIAFFFMEQKKLLHFINNKHLTLFYQVLQWYYFLILAHQKLRKFSLFFSLFLFNGFIQTIQKKTRFTPITNNL